MDKKISILLSNYNGEKYLEQAIESVLDQTYGAFEFIIVDDASTDGSRAIIDRYNDVRIVRHYSDKNRNLAYSLNLAIELAKGEYIARIDSDDIWEADKLEKQIAYMEEEPECGACFTKVNLIGTDSESVNEMYSDLFRLFNEAKNMTQKKWLRYFFYTGNRLCHSSVLIRRSALDDAGGRFNIAYVGAEDYELWTRLVRKHPIHIMEDRLVRYRWEESDSKISGFENGKQYQFLNICMLVRKKLMETITDDELIEYFKEDFSCSDSHTKDELKCERAYILLKCGGENNNFLGTDKYEELLRDPKMLRLLEEKMGFELTKYYSNYRAANFNITEELREKQKMLDEFYKENRMLSDRVEELDEKIKILNEENTGLNNEKAALLEKLYEQQNVIAAKQDENEHYSKVISDIMNSRSWKLTKPMRAIGNLFKRDK